MAHYWASSLPQVNRSAAETRRQYQVDSGGPGARSSGSRADEITLHGMNVIGPRACHQHMGPQLLFDYIVKGSDGGKERLQAVWLETHWKGESEPGLWLVCAPDTGRILFY